MPCIQAPLNLVHNGYARWRRLPRIAMPVIAACVGRLLEYPNLLISAHRNVAYPVLNQCPVYQTSFCPDRIGSTSRQRCQLNIYLMPNMLRLLILSLDSSLLYLPVQ